ncbi:MAG TPA: hypothetical protein VM031_00470 [Phycisphaerae bacterium]|nr:hypothetical protein [Phycisphaerae bacterium]
MRFLRENLFFVGLIGATVVIGTVGLIWYFTSDVGEQLRSRKGLSNKLIRLSGRHTEKVNEGAVKKQGAKIKALEDAVKRDVADSVAFNKTHLPLLKIKAGGGLPEDAFPIDEKRYADLGLDFVFIKEYKRVLNEMILPARSDLRRTSLATPEEIKQQEALLKEQFGVKAREKAIQFLKVKRAGDGLIFIEDGALDRYFTKETKASSAKMWEAQVNLWVTREVLEAIIATNTDVLEQRRKAGTGPVSADVLSSAVKRLAKIHISEAFALSAAGGGLFGTKGQPGSFTQRFSTADYGVVPYRFTVVMPPRHVGKLLERLMARNYHTVVNVAMAQVSPDSAYYYGVEPTMIVNISGELLLLLEWVRPLMPPAVAARLPKTAGGA